MGGKTIAEAKERLSWVEVREWMVYAEKRGTLNAGLRTEACFARLLVYVAAFLGRKKDNGAPFQVADFAPHLGENKPTAPEEIDDALMAFFGKQDT